MKKLFFIFSILLLLSCESDDGARRNPFLIDISFQTSLNTDLPQYSGLNFPGTSVIVPNQGIRGIIVYHIGNNQYRAHELSDPNHAPNSCSTMTVNNIEATCPCTDDTNKYSIVSGQNLINPNSFPMKAYRVTRSGNNVIISN